jgi:putative acetyltransferase
MIVRREQAGDVARVRAVNLDAFGSSSEADIVDMLRADSRVISLVADDGGEIVGHIMFSPVHIVEQAGLVAAALAPMAVHSQRQRHGIGSNLIRTGLEECRRAGIAAMFVVGHPSYYPRFGFATASRFGFTCEFDVPDEVFMAMELIPGALAAGSGTVCFHEAFRNA